MRVSASRCSHYGSSCGIQSRFPGVRLGLAPAWACARERAECPEGQAALLLLGLRGREEDRSLLFSALQDPPRRSAALWALGFLGTPEAGDAALEWLEDQALAPLAGEVFTAVTGVDLGASAPGRRRYLYR